MWPRSIFGYDFFISYRRSEETTPYALRLFDDLRKRNYRCFIDREEFEAGPGLERRLVSAVRNSSILLLVLSPGAARSTYVQLEVRAALATGRKIVFINVGQSYSAAEWALLASSDPVWIAESTECLASGKPSAEVLDHVERSFTKPRLNAVRQRLLVTAIAALLMLLTAVGVLWIQERTQANRALAQQLAAQSQLVTAEQPFLLERAALLAIESARRQSSLEGDTALRDSARLLPRLIRRWPTKDFVQNLVLSPDRTLAAVTSGNSLALLKSDLGAELTRFERRDWIWVVRFSPNGQFLAAGSEDGAITLIDVKRAQQTHELHHAASVEALAFSPDGQLLASASEDNTAALWRLADGHQVASLKHPDSVVDVQFSADGRYLATGSLDQTARIWSLQPPHVIAKVRLRAPPTPGKWLARGGSTQTVRFSGDGRWLAVAGLDGDAAVVDTRTWRESYRLRHTGFVSSLAFTPDSKALVVVVPDEAIVWDLSDGEQISTLRHVGVVFDLQFSPSGRLLATGSEDRTTRVWDTNYWSELWRVCAKDTVSGVAFRKESELLTSGEALALWDLNAGMRRVLPRSGTTLGLAYSPDGATLAAASAAPCAWRVLDWQARDLCGGLDARSVAFSPDGTRFAAGSYGGETAAFEVSSGQRLFTHKLHKGPVNSVAFSPDGRLLVSGGTDKTAIAWDAAHGLESWRYVADEEIETVRFSPDGSWLAIGTWHPAVNGAGAVVIMTRTGDRRAVLDRSAPGALAWSPDGRRLAVGLASGIVRVHGREGGGWTEERNMAGDQGVVRDVAFSHTGRLLASGGSDGTVRVWETAEWEEVSRLRFPSVVTGIAFNPADSTLAASFNGIVEVNPVNIDDLVREACLHLTRPLGADEWMRFLHSKPREDACADTRTPTH